MEAPSFDLSSLPPPDMPDGLDAELLAVCAKLLDLWADRERQLRELRELAPYRNGNRNPILWEVKRQAELIEEMRENGRLGRSPMVRIGRLKASTPAGIYAKALVLRKSSGQAPKLAMTLADDLLNCRELRAILWPPGGAA